MSSSLQKSIHQNPFIQGRREDYILGNFIKVALLVVVLHSLVWLLFKYGLPDFQIKKRPDITIEIGAALPASQPIAPQPQPVQQQKIQERSPDAQQKAAAQQPTPPAPSQPQNISDNVMTQDADYKAASLNNPPPPYPGFAFRNRWQGKVYLRVHVMTTGEVDEVKLLQTSGYDSLDNSALDTVKKWKFIPAKKEGKIVDQWVRVPITFEIK
jgi:protein TonB